jgi:RNA polymerase sigma factor (sigma-70 family)
MMCTMPPPELDRLVARAQRGDRLALEALCARVRPMLVRHARRLLGRSADAEDAVQDVLVLVCARIGTYRWEGTFAGWLYAIATRSILRRAASSPREAALAVDLADRALISDHDAMTEAEWRLVEQDLHLACTIGVLTALSPGARRLYLLGEVLAVPDRVGAQVAQVTRATYRKRLERAAGPSRRRREIPRRTRQTPSGSPSPHGSWTSSPASGTCTARTRAGAPPTARSARSSAWRRRSRPKPVAAGHSRA